MQQQGKINYIMDLNNQVLMFLIYSVAPKFPQSMSNIPWRKAGVKYTQNEIYFDIIEEIDATIAA